MTPTHMILTHLLKSLHVLIAISLMGCAISCLVIVSSKQLSKQQLTTCYTLNKLMLALVCLAMLLGTLLVHPKHYTFQTHWIQAAYFFVGVFILCLFSLHLVIKKNKLIKKYLWQCAYLALVIIILFIMRDAVTKSSLFF
jgi:hypothetical protein